MNPVSEEPAAAESETTSATGDPLNQIPGIEGRINDLMEHRRAFGKQIADVRSQIELFRESSPEQIPGLEGRLAVLMEHRRGFDKQIDDLRLQIEIHR